MHLTIYTHTREGVKAFTVCTLKTRETLGIGGKLLFGFSLFMVYAELGGEGGQGTRLLLNRD